MILVKLNIIFMVYNFFVRTIPALDAPQVLKATRYKMISDWPSKPSGTENSDADPAQLLLPQPSTFYIAPATVHVVNLVSQERQPQSIATPFTISKTTIKPFLVSSAKQLISLEAPSKSEVFPNGLTTSELVDATANTEPLNPAPMLKPNPFVNSEGKKIQFNTINKKQEEGSFCRRTSDGLGGYCILAYQCVHALREYRMHNTKIDICTYRKNIPVICCPLADKHVNELRISAQKCQEYHKAAKDIKLSPPSELSINACVSSVPLIVGGKVTKKSEYPHMAALGWAQDDGQYKFGCGGTLVSDMYVLTAAHCATSGGKPPEMVRLGAQNLNHTTNSVLDIKILIIILHPKYRSSSYYHDIALLKLTKRVKFSVDIQPACLWSLPNLNMSTGIATGWGRTEFLGQKSVELQKVDLNIIDDKKCKQIYSKERRLPRSISDEQFCAGHLEGGKDTCQGDSGGPLHVELPEFNCVKYVIGITSFGKFCAAPNSPGVYTKIYSYLDWIEKIVFKI